MKLLLISCLLLASALAQTDAVTPSTETKDAQASLNEQKKELKEAESEYMKLVDSMHEGHERVAKQADDVEKAQQRYDEAVAKDVANFKKTTERQAANIDRQTASVEQAAEREGQLSQQRINSVTKAIERNE